MNIMEIVLLVIGILVFVASFLIPNGKGDNLAHDREMARDEIGDLVARELERIRSQVDDTVEEAIKDSMDKTERSLEKLSNEKIMAVSEYSETVLGQINKSQQEILFLYDMLNAKHDNLKNTASEVEQRVKEAEIPDRCRDCQQGSGGGYQRGRDGAEGDRGGGSDGPPDGGSCIPGHAGRGGDSLGGTGNRGGNCRRTSAGTAGYRELQ